MIDKSAFDLFSFLNKLNTRNLNSFNTLSEDGKKAAHPLVLMRWLSGTSDVLQIIRLNEVVNKYIFSLSDHKELLIKLLGAACTGKTSRSTWIKGPSGTPTKLALEAIKAKFHCSTKEAEQNLHFLQQQDIIEYAEQAGWDKEQIKKLALEFSKTEVNVKSKHK